jgi:hypothetical protein
MCTVVVHIGRSTAGILTGSMGDTPFQRLGRFPLAEPQMKNPPVGGLWAVFAKGAAQPEM